jgi:hypothetical protein
VDTSLIRMASEIRESWPFALYEPGDPPVTVQVWERLGLLPTERSGGVHQPTEAPLERYAEASLRRLDGCLVGTGRGLTRRSLV